MGREPFMRSSTFNLELDSQFQLEDGAYASLVVSSNSTCSNVTNTIDISSRDEIVIQDVQFYRESTNESNWKDLKYSMNGQIIKTTKFNDEGHSYDLDGTFFALVGANDQ